ncbi:transporter substrate-binding domain-containing protein [Pseudomonas sp. PDM15]|uniref:substrate-binding periplasmic protein n=1 Tax=Pseudomonas sp. PDM15 TaxID=2769303 RepID=UPI00177F6C5F|nr:transporter substrate-binding domain-containing protein [Pseudomonas sp. PDM15]MBD9426725.1 transporter substrate-binding domain-containing protein [Pseudomonas sp. PDM15]
MPNPLQFSRLVHLAALLCAALAWQPAGAATPAPEYRVGVEAVDYYPIYSAVPPDNHYRGYARELLDLFAARENLRLTYVALPVRRLLHAYRAGQVDLVFPDNPRWETKDKPAGIRYSQPVLQFQDAMLVLPKRLGQPRASFRKLGFVRGFTPWKFQDDIAAGRVSIHESPNPEGLIRMTLAGYIDAANMARFHLKRLGRPDSLMVEPILLPLRDSYYHLSSIRHPELIQRFDAFLLREQQAVKALKDKYEL